MKQKTEKAFPFYTTSTGKLEAESDSKTKISIKIVEINNNAMNKALKFLKF